MATPTLWKNQKDIGKRIKLLREARGMKQRAFADFGIKQAYLASIEGGTIMTPSPDMLANIAKALQVSVKDLIEGTELESPYRKVGTQQKAFCPNNACPKLAYNRLETGMSIPHRFRIDRFQKSGDTTYEARHCPYCGTELFTSCPGCGKPFLIADPLQTHCLHCGEAIFRPIRAEDMKANAFE